MNQVSAYLFVSIFSRLTSCGSVILMTTLFFSSIASSETPYNNYLLNCMGCHGEEGQGLEKEIVPNMQGVIGNFLKVPEGRAYLIQVPGSAQAPISNLELAQLMNYLIDNFSGDSKPADFTPYTEAEVTTYRKVKLIDVGGTRKKLMELIQAKEQVLKVGVPIDNS